MSPLSASLICYVIIAVSVHRILSLHLSQIGSRGRTNHHSISNGATTPSPRQQRTETFSQVGFQNGARKFYNRGGSSNMLLMNMQRIAPIIHRNSNINRNINNNLNINHNVNMNNGPTDTSSTRMAPISHSMNRLIQQQILTRQILINLLRKQLLDMNGRYTQNPSARGADFIDPRTLFKPQPMMPNFDISLSKPKQQDSITIESSGSFTISEVKGPGGQTQIVIDTRKKPTGTTKNTPIEDPHEVP